MNPQTPSGALEHEHVFRFRIYRYRNRRGLTAYKAKQPVSWLGGLVWRWVTEDDVLGTNAWGSDILSVNTARLLEELLIILCERRVARAAQTDTLKRRHTFRLTTIEDISMSVPVASQPSI